MSTLRVDNIKSRTGSVVTVPETNTLAVTGIVSVTSSGSITNAGNLTNTGSLTNSGNVNITGGITTVGGAATISGNVWIAGITTISGNLVNTGTFTQSGTFSPTNINTSGINVTGIATAQDFNALSDINCKENVITVNNALNKVEQLRGVSFDWKETGRSSYGVIAQELEAVLPELVKQGEVKSVNYNGIIGVLIEAIKELKKEVEDLKNTK